MTHDLVIRPLVATDAATIAAAFDAVAWSKPEQLFTRYAQEGERGKRECFVAEVSGKVAGYCTLLWMSEYPPFREQDIPEVSDLNVLPEFRGAGIGNRLLDAVEAAAAKRGTTVGLGVGLYADYGPAQRIYVRRGYVPDGRGVMYANAPVEPGGHLCLDDDATLMLVRVLNQQAG